MLFKFLVRCFYLISELLSSLAAAASCSPLYICFFFYCNLVENVLISHIKASRESLKSHTQAHLAVTGRGYFNLITFRSMKPLGTERLLFIAFPHIAPHVDMM